MAEDSVYHNPVMLAEVMEWLQISEDGVYVDATFGGGGHSRAIMNKLGSGGKLIVFDQDADAAKNVWDDERLIFVPQNFRHIKRYLKYYQVGQADGILADLGVSSHQFDEADRGFSFRFDARLDMRMNQQMQVTAADVLNTYDQKQLQNMLSKYGEVTNAKTLSEYIVESRVGEPFGSTNQFCNRLNHLIRGNRNQYFAKVFQALRIEVNDEMSALNEFLSGLYDILKPGGRAVIITYHSLEDRMVKNLFKTGNTEGKPEKDFFGNTKQFFNVLTKKAITPSLDEQQKNSRSRSAKLRVAERISL
jgi:16S rRNA (cytosine1402-N4)-methyltransferase